MSNCFKAKNITKTPKTKNIFGMHNTSLKKKSSGKTHKGKTY
jgi:hypothetical protein